jgi:hypothetical protein
MGIPRDVRLLAAALALGAALAACSASTSSPASSGAPAGSTSAPAAGGAQGDTATGAGEAAPAGGEAPSIRFVSARNHYRVDAPGTMTENSNGVASSNHGLESLTITVVTGSNAADPNAYAKSDLDSQRTKSGFAQKSGPSTFTLSASRSSVKTVYTAAGAANPVTGKAQTFVNVRYYVPRDASTLAVLSYSIVQDQYDPQGADDVANTFAWQ